MEDDRTAKAEARQRLIGRTFERALDDAEFREAFLANRIPEVEGAGNRPRRSLPEEALAKRRELMAGVLDRAAGDQSFRRELIQNPRKALRDGGFRPQLEQLRAELPQEEVQGYTWTWSGGWATIAIITDNGSGFWWG